MQNFQDTLQTVKRSFFCSFHLHDFTFNCYCDIRIVPVDMYPLNNGTTRKRLIIIPERRHGHRSDVLVY